MHWLLQPDSVFFHFDYPDILVVIELQLPILQES